jgi:hypothetical protein
MGRIEVKENTLRGFSFCLVQIIMLYCKSRFDLQSPQVLFAKLHFRTGNSKCHVGVQEGGFGRHPNSNLIPVQV